ncbi:MAG: PH domain-containing protein [Actinobacteria bacterium]|nr:PH domain-containing protein [Actinomycetota bacterium]
MIATAMLLVLVPVVCAALVVGDRSFGVWYGLFVVAVLIAHEFFAVRLLRSGARVSSSGVSLRGAIRNRMLTWDEIERAEVVPGVARIGRPIPKLVLVTAEGSRVTVPTFGRYSAPFATRQRLAIIAEAINDSRPNDAPALTAR